MSVNRACTKNITWCRILIGMAEKNNIFHYLRKFPISLSTEKDWVQAFLSILFTFTRSRLLLVISLTGQCANMFIFGHIFQEIEWAAISYLNSAKIIQKHIIIIQLLHNCYGFMVLFLHSKNVSETFLKQISFWNKIVRS